MAIIVAAAPMLFATIAAAQTPGPSDSLAVTGFPGPAGAPTAGATASSPMPPSRLLHKLLLVPVQLSVGPCHGVYLL